MNFYGKAVWECLTVPRTLEEIRQATGFQTRYVLEGIRDARQDGYAIVAIPGERTEDGVEPTTFMEDRV